jgi:hypothetical protein
MVRLLFALLAYWSAGESEAEPADQATFALPSASQGPQK